MRERRHNLIIKRLRESGDASIEELSRAADVSQSTIYRDLKWLSERGVLQMTRGGAVLPSHSPATFELDSAVAASVAAQEKAVIAAYAAKLVRPGQTVLFDSSTTVLATAREIAETGMPLTAITNSLEIGAAFNASRRAEVIVVGGKVRPGSPTLVGAPGLAFLGELHADIALLGTHAITGSQLTETSLEVVAMKQAIIRSARRVIALADGSKFQDPALFSICEASEIDELVTDIGAEQDALTALRDAGVTVHIADEQ